MLAGLEHTRAVRFVAEGIAQSAQVVGRGRSSRSHFDLHDGAGVGSVPGQDLGSTHRTEVRSASVVIITGDAGREGGGRIIVQDKGLAGELREVDDHVGALGRGQKQGMLVDQASVEAGGILDPGGELLAVNDDRGRQEAAFITDLDPIRAQRDGVLDRGGEDDRVGLRRFHFGRVEQDFRGANGLAEAVHAGAGRRGVTDIPLEIEEAVVGRIEHAEAIGFRLDGECGVGRTVHDRGVVELLHTGRDQRRAGDERRFAEGLFLVLPCGRIIEVAACVEVGVGNWRIFGILGRPEPGAVHPAAKGTHAARRAGVLRRHVDVVVPQIAIVTPAHLVPGGVLAVADDVAVLVDLVVELSILGHKGAVLDDKRDAQPKTVQCAAGSHKPLFGLVRDQITRSFTGIDVEPGDAPRVVVVEHQAGTLLVRVVEGLAAVVRAGAVGNAGIDGSLADHVGHAFHADTLGPVGILTGGGDPLVRRSI